MGLDMYLDVTKLISCFFWKEVKITVNNKELTSKGDYNEMGRIKEIKVNGIYWRKANAIHKWFVDNCQDGTDDCRASQVGREQLIELRDLCIQVKADHSKAHELLPFFEGFFFGTYGYDEWYFGAIEDTINEINILLKTFDDSWDFEYRSSW